MNICVRAWNCPTDILKYTRQMSGVKDPRLDRRLTEQINFSSTRTRTLLTTVSVTNFNCNNHANKSEISGNLPPCCGLSGTAMRCCIACGWWKRTSLISKKNLSTRLSWKKQKNKTKRSVRTGGTDQNWSIIVHFCSTCAVPLSVFVYSLRRRGDFRPTVILASKVRLHGLH